MERRDFLEEILQHVLALTGQHELETLTIKFIEAISLLYPHNDYRIYSFDHTSNSFELIHLHRHANIKSATAIETKDLVLLEQLKDDSEQQPNNQTNENINIYPIMAAGSIYSAVVIENIAPEDQNLEVFTYLLGIFANQTQLLVKSISDHLTGLFNRQKLNSTLNNVLASHTIYQRQEDQTAKNKQHFIAFFDIDFFKKINDNHGHLIGDEVLILLAQKTQKSFREGDMIFRYGGEEFAVILKYTNQTDAINALERFRISIDKTDFPAIGNMTISLGVAELEPGMQSVTALKRADNALYYSKENGRNQLNSYEQLVEQGLLEPVFDQPSANIELF